MSQPETTSVLVLFGATGNLAKKMLYPALYRIEERGALHQRLVGVSRNDWDDEQFAAHVDESVRAAVPDVDDGVLGRLTERFSYVAGDYVDQSTYDHLADRADPASVCLHYLAIPPALFERVITGLEKSGLLEHSKLLVEKPFGRDLESARELTNLLHTVLPEERIYRIDHFLGKEPVDNLLAFRYANPIFDAVWNRHYIDHIQLTMAEEFGVDTRGPLYETLGVVRDVVQNHLLQVVCLLTMEAPLSADAEAFGDERFKVLAATRAIEPRQAVFGQYRGYREVSGVAPDSEVATFAAVRLEVDTPRWYDVPIYLRAGKGMAVTATQATVVFKETPPLPFAADPGSPQPNELRFRIGPGNGVDLLVQTKLPGDDIHLVTTPLSVDYEMQFGRIPMAYERVLLEAMAGDRTQFARGDAIEEAWRIVDAVNDPPEPPEAYPVGSWGPPSASRILDRGRSWLDPA